MTGMNPSELRWRKPPGSTPSDENWMVPSRNSVRSHGKPNSIWEVKIMTTSEFAKDFATRYSKYYERERARVEKQNAKTKKLHPALFNDSKKIRGNWI